MQKMSLVLRCELHLGLTMLGFLEYIELWDLRINITRAQCSKARESNDCKWGLGHCITNMCIFTYLLLNGQLNFLSIPIISHKFPKFRINNISTTSGNVMGGL
jgi:hypothetical protein